MSEMMWISVVTFDIIQSENLLREARSSAEYSITELETTEMYACIAEVFGVIALTDVQRGFEIFSVAQ